jgi:hypothetical protein
MVCYMRCGASINDYQIEEYERRSQPERPGQESA